MVRFILIISLKREVQLWNLDKKRVPISLSHFFFRSTSNIKGDEIKSGLGKWNGENAIIAVNEAKLASLPYFVLFAALRHSIHQKLFSSDHGRVVEKETERGGNGGK